jgi:glycosyltransferase involved in cell wall biosynthesis
MCSGGIKLSSCHNRDGKWMNPAGRENLASVIIPTYNRAALLDETLASAAAQTYRPLEIIVVDDGSTDDTLEVVNHWRMQVEDEAYVELRYFRQENSGVGSARNRGLIESRGEFIQFLDSDDLLNRRKLSLQIACLRRYPQSGMAFSDSIRINDPAQWGSLALGQATLVESAGFYCNSFMLPMLGVCRREVCYEAGPWSEDMSLGEDEEYSLRLLLATERLVYMPGNLCAYRQHAGPRLTDAQKDRRGLIFAMRAYRRMVDYADSAGRLDDPRLVAALVWRLNAVLLPALKAGRHGLADEAIGVCRSMPVTRARRVRLAVYGMFNRLPGGVFGVMWAIWGVFRRALFEIPRREISRVRDAVIRGAKPIAEFISGRSAQPSTQTARGNHPAGG